tara:strand:+ start:135 stop:1067 length:933 start_codon:yes stop_codon:yes gene_type:complete
VYKKKLTILKDFLGESYRSGNEQLFFCPKCNHHKKKMSVNIDKDKFKCWVCDYRGSSIRRLVRRYGNYAHQKKWSEFEPELEISHFERIFFGTDEEEGPTTISLPSEFKPLATASSSLAAKPARRYLMERGISREDILRWKIGYCSSGDFGGRIIIPSFNCDGKVDYFVGRTYDGNWKKYMNPNAQRNIVFNELYVDWQSDLSIVEGAFDAIVAGNAVPILGSSLREDSRLIKNVVENDTPVYIALDPDAEKKALNLIKKLLTFDIELYKVNISPYTDVGEMSKEEYQRRQKSATLMTQESYLVNAIASI